MCLHCGRLGIHAAACFALQFDAYLRPGVAVMLRRENFVPPVRGVVSAYHQWALLLAPLEFGTTSKTGTRDDSIFLGTYFPRPQLESSSLASWLSCLFRRSQSSLLCSRLLASQFRNRCSNSPAKQSVCAPFVSSRTLVGREVPALTTSSTL